MLIRYSFALTAAVTAIPAFSADLTLKLQLPRMDIAEYHRPYVAAWIERASDQSYTGNVALWYDVNKRDNGGAKWLKEVRIHVVPREGRRVATASADALIDLHGSTDERSRPARGQPLRAGWGNRLGGADLSIQAVTA
jgi:hypothetical protein